MRKWLTILTLLSVLGTHARTIRLSPGGAGIQAAINEAVAGDHILLQEGVYREWEILIDRPIILQGEGKAVIDGQHKGTIFHILSDSVQILDLHLQGVGMSYIKEYAAIHVSHASHFRLAGLSMEDVFFGCHIEKSHYGEVVNNRIHSVSELEAASGNGVHMWHCSHMLVEGNELSGLRDGIYFEFVEESTVRNNDSYGHLRYGLHFMFSNNDRYEDNRFHSNGAGVAVMFSSNIHMLRNQFYDNWGRASYGLLLKEINDADIRSNVFLKNTVAIQVEGSNRIAYRHNRFERNGWAIKVVGACYKNEVKENDFLHNSFDLSYHSQINDNVFDRNYWSDYNGYDLDKNHLGDIPYRPVKLFSYIVNKTPETIVLLRSLFVFIINFSEKVTPIFTPDDLVDTEPSMHPFT